MPHLHVALGPRDAAPCDVAVVIDCIRATTTLAHALAAGYERVVCVGEIADAHALRDELGAGTVLGGERHGVRIPGFDLGNSPAEYASPQGTTLVLSTTNGTRAILQSAVESRLVLVGALVCLEAVVAAVAAAARGDVAVRCAGVRGELALDDVYVAGRMVESLAARLPEHLPTDAARVALATRHAFPTALAALEASQSARDLDGTGLEDDVARCARESVLGVAPRVETVAPGRAEVA